jgi:hypothetical protein
MAYYEKHIFKDPSNPKKAKYNRLYITTVGSKADKIVNDIFGKCGMKNARVKEGTFCDGQPTHKYSFTYSDQDEVVRVSRNFKNELLNDYISEVHTLQENHNGVFVIDKIIYEK